MMSGTYQELSDINTGDYKNLIDTVCRGESLMTPDANSEETFTQLTGIKLETALQTLPQKRLEEIRKTAGQVIEKKFCRGRGPAKYGNLPRCFTTEKIKRFFAAIKNPVVKQAFLIQFFYGLRVGEITFVRIDKYQNVVVIDNVKCGRTDYLPLIKGTEWLFDDRYFQDLSPHYLRKCFRAVCRDLGPEFCFVYGKAKNTGRNLRLYTTHSLRHTAIDLVRRGTNEFTASLFARHSLSNKFGVTATYFHKSFDELSLDLDSVFNGFIEVIA